MSGLSARASLPGGSARAVTATGTPPCILALTKRLIRG